MFDMFSTFRCTVLILAQKLVNKLGKPKMTKLTIDTSLYFTRCTKREGIHKYFKKRKRRKNPGSFVVEKALTAVSLL